ncbi:orotidine 5'-phosphate decarboxylase [Ophidiomyces ophidiicola]|uniref:Orotidine 5'-phosphate decarboxylase n=1 Tax=Ophidiomyces ophidiicola TaxID=1387563 RepID=A0ACB8V0F9_9EURO|nr:orotidine 5'-phosphate decarboxylase [Ophidiomyces ophidiicola]KAI1917684.1 orotidine 5'-phosphate decarboxylase [Ophidiomyces ophidiicola]KAI1919364.1 orotidine 5'-phosphate decarboxylase [Ophidiomyces ophidiicola]KAI1928338.1 orotidine 5'-phosphate decarboxylase [Ophidiomyces ophidiicola]KAI1951264.1 orotidine 5'-phosphate decarboxylase [Ophidiomyces ophidiicola]KAI1953592.1 orotidine 5'-phosphate decarboxylase [Ophidiomyces ophidiicola]
MASKSQMSYEQRAQNHPNPLARRLFQIATEKQSNIVVSADLTSTKELLNLADQLGPYMAVLKTHIDILCDFSPDTIIGLQSLAQKHNFLIFEDRKFVDIGNTVQKQYHGGALQISKWAHIVNATVLPGPGIIDALAQTATAPDFPDPKDRGLLILAEMTSKGSLASGKYTELSVELARKHKGFVLGFVATKSLGFIETAGRADDEDFILFTTGVNLVSKGDPLGQQYQVPESAIAGGADFIIAGRGIYGAADPLRAVQQYQKAGWNAYLNRVYRKS